MTDDQQIDAPQSPDSDSPGRQYGRRESDGRPHPDHHGAWEAVRSRDNWYRDVWLFVITVVVLATVVTAGYSFDRARSASERARSASEDSRQASEDAKKIAIDNRSFIKAINRESIARRDESCRYFERQEAIAVRQIRRTYKFLDGLTSAERRSSLTRAIVLGLPDQYRQAQADKAPSYCDDPRIGLPEPGPKLPKQRDFSFLLR